MGRSAVGADTQLPVKSPLMLGYLTQNLSFAASLKAFDAILSMLPIKVLPERPIRRILISNWGQLGDVYCASGLISLIRQFLPGTQIGFLVSSAGVPALSSTPGVSNVHVVDNWFISRSPISRKQKLTTYLATRRKALEEIRAMQYDAAIETFSHPPNSGSLLWQAGIPRRIGYPIGAGGRFFTDLVPWVHDPKRHVLQDHITLFDKLLRKPTGVAVHPALFPSVPGSDIPQARLKLLQEPYVLLHVGTGGPLKEWPTAHWTNLAVRLAGEGARLVFTGRGPREAEVIQEVIQHVPEALNLCDKLSYKEFVTVLRNASLVVGVDSVAAHLAGGANIPGVFIYHGMSDILRWSPVSERRVVLSAPLPCSPCQSGRGCKSMGCVRLVSPVEVAEECLALMRHNQLAPNATP